MQVWASELAPRTPRIQGYLLLGLWARQVQASLGKRAGTSDSLNLRLSAAGALGWASLGKSEHVGWYPEILEFRATCCWGSGLSKPGQVYVSGLSPADEVFDHVC